MLVAFDLVLRYGVDSESLNLLTAPFVQLNGLQLAALALVAVVVVRFLPPVHRRAQLKRRAARFHRDWKQFKRVLVEYQDSKSDALQQSYSRLRERLHRDYSYFAPTLIRIKKSFPHGEYAESGVNNLGDCLRPVQISEWRSRVRRSLPDEVDCFDEMFLALSEHGPDMIAHTRKGR